jgi:ApbE superfamily uncharacterized protein (UPF0280 family)
VAGAIAVTGARRSLLPGGRQHFQHGPIDLVLEARGAPDEVRAAGEQAWARFQPILDALVAELALLRAPLGDAYPLAKEPVARRMIAACWPHRGQFVTPMAAVAGSVADEILLALRAGRILRSAYVNDGGDIAVWVAPGETLNAGIAHDPIRRALGAAMAIDRPCGLATSGWKGRSQSLGIADAVTVVAADAAAADAAATLIANAVDVEHPAVRRLPACAVKHDSDLGARLVTVDVGPLPQNEIATALRRGVDAAMAMLRNGLIHAALLALHGEVRAVGMPAPAGCDKLTATASAPVRAIGPGLEFTGRSA